MNKLIDIAKGSLMGIANIIPGVSGGTIAVVFRIYDKIIHAINIAVKNPFEALKQTYLYLIGMILGVLAGVFLISYGYEQYPLPTTLIFIGLIGGGLKSIIAIVKKQPIGIKNYLIFALFFVLIIVLPLISSNEQIGNGLTYYIMLFIVGFLAAFTMIAPGISGSMVLLIIGYYQHILDIAKRLFQSVYQFDLIALNELLIPVLILAIGAIIGALVTSKLMAYLMNKHEISFYYGVLGMIVASPFAILFMLNETNKLSKINISHYIVGIILMIGAALLSYVMVHKYENKES